MGLSRKNYDMSKRLARKLVAAVDKQAANTATGDCSLANDAIKEGTGRFPLHPLLLAVANCRPPCFLS